MKIIPTIGCIVWYYATIDQLQPMAAIVAKVHELDADIRDEGNYHLNFRVIQDDGAAFPMRRVRLVQEGERLPQFDFCTWMPYQVGQAKKHEKERTGDTVTETT